MVSTRLVSISRARGWSLVRFRAGSGEIGVSTRSEWPQNPKQNHPRAPLLETSRTPSVDRLLELELRVADLHRIFSNGLPIFAAGVAPADVLVGRLVHVPARIMHDIASMARMTGRRAALLDVVERVLRDVADARVGMLPDRARRRLDLARQAFN